VLEQAEIIVRTIDSQFVTVNAWHMMTPMLAVGTLDPTPYPTPRDQEEAHVRAVRSLTERYDISPGDLYVESGSPSDVINDVAFRIDAGLIVMGTVARTGIRGALIGNTAERVLEATSCDIMVVKLPLET